MGKDRDRERRDYIDRSKGVGWGPAGFFRWSSYAPQGGRWHPAMIGGGRRARARSRVRWRHVLAGVLLGVFLIAAILAAAVLSSPK